MTEEFKIKVFRYDPQTDDEPYYEEYSVDHYEGMRIWWAIDNVNAKHKANIAWRLSCREFLCGICTIMANGKPTLACKAPVENGMLLEPLPYFPIVKDLVIDRDIAESRFQKLKPWLQRDSDISRVEVKVHHSKVLPGAKTIITGCSECYRAFTIDYPRYLPDVEMPEVKHISEVIAESKDKLGILSKKMPDSKVTYHDPCRLGRDCGIYQAPREVISTINGIEFCELAKTKAESMCCGAGGGVKFINNDLAIDVGKARIRQAKETGSSVIVSCCPWCEQNLKNSIKDGDGVRVLDIVDIITENV